MEKRRKQQRMNVMQNVMTSSRREPIPTSQPVPDTGEQHGAFDLLKGSDSSSDGEDTTVQRKEANKRIAKEKQAADAAAATEELRRRALVEKEERETLERKP